MINRVKPDVEDDERGYDLKFLLKLLCRIQLHHGINI